MQAIYVWLVNLGWLLRVKADLQQSWHEAVL